MKTAVVFYSLDGNCAFVAEQVKNQLNADLIRLQLKDEKRRRGFLKILWGCAMVFSRKKPALKPYTFDPSAYDLIVIGAPVWADNPAAPLRTFFAGTAITGKKIALYACYAGGKGGAALGKLKTTLAHNEIISEKGFSNPAKNAGEEIKQQITDWAKSLTN